MAKKRKPSSQENDSANIKNIKLEPKDNISAPALASCTTKDSVEAKEEVATKKVNDEGGVKELDESFSALDASFSQSETKETKSKTSSISLIKDIVSGMRDWSFQGRCVFKRKFKPGRNQTPYAFSVDFRDTVVRV
jgi:hypothetical protein